MVKREKVVVILLIITIILSIFSVVVTLTASPASADDSGASDNGKQSVEILEDRDSATIGFTLEAPEAAG